MVAGRVQVRILPRHKLYGPFRGTASGRKHERRKPTVDEIPNRLEALDRSVRVALANGGHETTKDTVDRAKAFLDFLTTE